MENMEVMEHGETSFMKWHQKPRDRKVFQAHKNYLCHIPGRSPLDFNFSKNSNSIYM